MPPRLERAMSYMSASREYGTLGQTIMTVVGGLFVAAGAMIAAMGSATANLVVTILDAFGIGGREWIFAFTRAPANFIADSFGAAAASMMSGAWSQLGPFLPIVAAATAVGVVWIVSWYLDQRDSDVPGLGIDLPVIGNDEAQGNEEDN